MINNIDQDLMLCTFQWRTFSLKLELLDHVLSIKLRVLKFLILKQILTKIYFSGTISKNAIRYAIK